MATQIATTLGLSFNLLSIIRSLVGMEQISRYHVIIGINRWVCAVNINLECVVWPRGYPNGPEAGREAGWGFEFVPLKKKWSWKFYPAAHNFTNCMLFWNTHTFQTILLWKRYHLIHWLSIFSKIQRNNYQSARNTSCVLQLCCALVRDLT